MKAQVVGRYGPLAGDSLVLSEVPVPEPGPGEILVRVLACGVCRTDLHVIEGDLPVLEGQRIPGHEVVGEVVRSGPRTKGRFKMGDRVGVAWLYRACGHCPYCLRGDENLCLSPLFTGYHRPGGYAEYIVGDEAFCYPLPPGEDPVLQAPLLCAGIIGYRAYAQAGLQGGQTLGLYGFGASASLVLALARSEGVRVFVSTRGSRHREWALAAGADWVGEHAASVPPELLNAAILFAPAGELVPPIMAALDRGGTLLLAGIHVTDIPKLDYQRELFYEKRLRSVTANTRKDGRDWLSASQNRGLRPEVTVYPFAEALKALADLKEDRLKGVAVLKI
jgi:propanol-preferring alcohol dehydrogenase